MRPASLPLAAAVLGLAVLADAEPRLVTRLTARSSGGADLATVIVDAHDAPDLAAWGKRAGERCLDWLPRLAALLPSEGFAAPREVTLRLDPAYDGVAKTEGRVVTLSADWIRRHPDDDGMVIHELVHVVQDYRGQGESWLTEGIADYVRYWLYEPGKRRFDIVRGKSHYREGYGTAGAFLEWIERTRAAGIVAKLNAASRQGRYREALFEEICGKPLDSLWEEFVEASQPP